MNASQPVQALVADVRRRWRRRALLHGAALSLLTLALAGSAVLLLYAAFDAPLFYVALAAGIGALVLLGVVAHYVLRPAFRRISDREVALFIEEKVPGLEDRLNSAVEIDDPAAARKAHGALVDGLLDDLARRTRALPLTTVVDARRARLLAWGSAALGLVFAVFAVTTLGDLRTALVGADLATLVPGRAPALTVRPGNAEIEQGASQEVVVTLREESSRDVTLHYRTEDGPWQKAVMAQGFGEPAYLHEFVDVQAPIEYFAEHDGHRAGPFTLTLYTFPAVARIDVTYTYPAYTGLAPRTEADGGDLRGLKGSTATVTVHATGAVRTGALLLDDGRRVPLAPAGDGRFRGSLRLEAPGGYTVDLTDAQDKKNKFPTAYQIVPYDDERPAITLTDPQRDVRVNAVEEVRVAARVQDDYGLKAVRLRYAVGGAAEQTIPLLPDTLVRPTDVEGDYLFFLEDFSLQPGDVISYYVEAEDHFHPGVQASDMYFIEVVPFDRRYRQAANQGGMPGGGQPSATVLSQQQIIAATWKLHRERGAMAPAAFDEARRGLVGAQATLKRSIEERINATAFSTEMQRDEDTRRIADHLRAAVREMGEAVRELERDRLQEALSPERRALNALLRADALNRERRVALGRNPGGGGGGGATEERMTELMDLELDISKDKYEVQQQRPSTPQQQTEEAFDALRELARRQQNLANQARRPPEGEDRKRHVERLQRDQEQLRRQAEELAQRLGRDARQSGRQGGRIQEELDRAADQMREAERALREGDARRAATRQQQALDALNKIQEDLRYARRGDTRGQLDDLTQAFDDLARREEQLGRDLRRTADDTRRTGARPEADALERLAAQRQATREAVERLERQAGTLQERLREESPELSAAARDVAQRLRREELAEQMRASEEALERGWLDRATRLEGDIEASLRRLEADVRALDGGLPTTDEERLARALDDVRELDRRLRALQPGASPSPAPGASPDRQARADAARAQRQMEQAREALGRLQQQLGGDRAAQALARQVDAALARADNTGTRLDGDAARAFFEARIFTPLSQLEAALTRQLDRLAVERKLYGSRRADVPSEYRELVEKYYESLSKGGQ